MAIEPQPLPPELPGPSEDIPPAADRSYLDAGSAAAGLS